MITNSLEWIHYRPGRLPPYRDTLQDKINALPFNADLRRLLKNIDEMVADLSRLEVEARRTKSQHKVEDQLAKINAAITTLEQWLIMAALIG